MAKKIKARIIQKEDKIDIDKMLEAHPNKESHYNWQNGEDVFNWWLGIDENQMTFFEEET